MSVKSVAAALTAESSPASVIRLGYLRKLKTSKKKYFALRAETPESSARLEYYDSEKKFRAGQGPKRSIPLKTCFNINRRVDTKHKNVIALYTKDDCFCVVLDTEDELEEWLKALLSLQHGEEVLDGEVPKPTFEHVWQVTVLNRGLGGSSRNILGSYRLCLTARTLSLVRKDKEHPDVEFSLTSIRSCGSLNNFFYMEVGRSSCTGAGEFWMDTEDTNIAQNMHQTVLHAMSHTSSSREELGPKPRTRSSSATESSKPIMMQYRRQTHSGAQKPNNYSPSQGGMPMPFLRRKRKYKAGSTGWSGAVVHHQRTQSLPLAHPAPSSTEHPYRAAKRNPSSKCMAGGRDRCDSMPSSHRARTTSEGNHPVPIGLQSRLHLAPHRPHSFISHSPPAGSPVSPPSAACSTDSAGSSLSMNEDEIDGWTLECQEQMHGGRYGHSLTPDEAIAEENCDDCLESPYIIPQCGSSPMTTPYVPMAPHSSDDGYVDMSPRGRHTDMSPAASTSSVTSGTPSTDMRFAEYPLEKVCSYLNASEEDDTSSTDRPTRAYSVGSRPETLKFKTRVSESSVESARVRAFSLGSKSKKPPCRVLPPHGPPVHPRGKSSSAPLLSESRIHGSHSSVEPMDHLMEVDFSKPPSAPTGYVNMNPGRKTPSGYVEMKPGFHSDNTPTTPELPYMDMRPSSSPQKPSFMSPQTEHPPYVDMRPSSHYYTVATPTRDMHINTRPSTSPMQASVLSPKYSCSSSCDSNPDYMDMDPSNKRHMRASQPTDARLTVSPKHNTRSISDYMDMNKSQKTENKRTEKIAITRSSSTRQAPSPLKATQPDAPDYMDMDFQNRGNAQNLSTEASRLHSILHLRHQRKSSLDSAKVNTGNDDYANMSGASAKKKERKGSKKEKVQSQPITIQNATKVNSSTSPVYSFITSIGRKHSTGTPPKTPTNLPLHTCTSSNPFSSLPRQRVRKTSRRDSKENTTPTEIFPLNLNSPATSSTPLKIPTEVQNIRYKPSPTKETEPSTPTSSNCVNDDYTLMDFEKQKPATKASTTPSGGGDSDYVNFNPAAPKPKFVAPRVPTTDHGDYAIMNISSPFTSSTVPVTTDHGDYARLNAGPLMVGSTALTTTNTGRFATVPISSPSSAIATQLSFMALAGVAGFKPITADPKAASEMASTAAPAALHKSYDSLRSENISFEGAEAPSENLCPRDPCISPVAKLSRPNSVNSEKVTPQKASTGPSSRPSSVGFDGAKGTTLSRPSSVSSELGSSTSTIVAVSRPDSVNSDRVRPNSVNVEGVLHYASLDLAPSTADDDGDKSPRGGGAKVAVDGASSPTQGTAQPPGFTYAQIDFVKSENFNKALSNAKIKF